MMVSMAAKRGKTPAKKVAPAGANDHSVGAGFRIHTRTSVRVFAGGSGEMSYDSSDDEGRYSVDVASYEKLYGPTQYYEDSRGVSVRDGERVPIYPKGFLTFPEGIDPKKFVVEPITWGIGPKSVAGTDTTAGGAATPTTSRGGDWEDEEDHLEGRLERSLQIGAGELDVGQEDYYEYSSRVGGREAYEGRLKGLRESSSAGVGVSASTSHEGTCMYRVAKIMGIKLSRDTTRVVDIPDVDLEYLRNQSHRYKVLCTVYSKNDRRNHIECVTYESRTAKVSVMLVGPDGKETESREVRVINLENFFMPTSTNTYADVRFYASSGDGQFGHDAEGTFGGSTAYPRAPPSVVDDSPSHGRANVNGGVTRSRRRVMAAKTAFEPGIIVKKGYVAAGGLMFNNLSEMFDDTISRDYAQEILESVFAAWGVPISEPGAAKFAEDLVWAFLVAMTASNKANYDKYYQIPVSGGEIEVGMKVLSDVLESNYGVTRRQFARAVANDLRGYLKLPENVHLLPDLARRAGCDPQMASLAFDGSTHCTGMTSAETSFTKLLQARNLFEDDSAAAEDASSRLMQGLNSGIRSKVSR